jgi:hypothetical protein
VSDSVAGAATAKQVKEPRQGVGGANLCRRAFDKLKTGPAMAKRVRRPLADACGSVIVVVPTTAKRIKKPRPRVPGLNEDPLAERILSLQKGLRMLTIP